MNNYGFGFGGGFGGGAQMPWGAAGQGMARPQFQQTPYIPGPRQFPQLPPNYRRDMPYLQQRQSTLTPARPVAPPVARGVGAGLGGTAAQTGSPGYASSQIKSQLQNPNFQPGFLSVPPEQTPVQPTYQSRMPQIPTQPPVGGPPRQLTPSESAQLRSMDQQQQNFQYRDQNLPRYQSAVDDINRQTDSMERTQLPDVNSPNFQPITPQQAFMQIPGNYLSGYQDRFNRIKANPSPNVESQASLDSMTASQPTVTMPNYAQRLAQADPRISGVYDSGNGYAMSDEENRITPMPRASIEDGRAMPGYLHAPELNRIAAVGGSAREWEAKSRWMADKGFTEYTPEVAQAYTTERHQKRLAENDAAFARKMQGVMKSDAIRELKARQAGQYYRQNNPQLFTNPDFVAAQLQSSLGGGTLQKFEQAGLSPEKQAAMQLQNRQYNLERANMEQDPIRKQQILQAMDAEGGGRGGYGGGGGPQSPSNPWLSWMGGSGTGGGGVGGPPQMNVEDAVFRQQNTTPEKAKATLEEWYSRKHRPSQQELDAAGISQQDIEDYKNSKASSLDWIADKMYGINALWGNNSTDERTKEYQWAGGLTGKDPTWWDNQFGAGWNTGSGSPKPYTPGSEAEGAAGNFIRDWGPTVAASLLPYGIGRAAKYVRGLRGAASAAKAAIPVAPPTRGFVLKPGSAPPTSPVRPPRPQRGLTVRHPSQARPVGPPASPQYQPQGQIGQQQYPAVGGQPNPRLPYYPPEGGIPGMNPPMGPTGVPLVPRTPPGGLSGYAVPGYSNQQLLQNPAYIQRLKELELEFSGAY